MVTWNKKHGTGTYYFADGFCKYKGEWKNDLYEGFGTLYYHDNNKEGDIEYEGSFKKGLAHGEGKYYADGAIEYDGEWVKDKREGFGKVYQDG